MKNSQLSTFIVVIVAVLVIGFLFCRRNISENFQPLESAVSRPVIGSPRAISSLSSYSAPFQLSRNQEIMGAPVPIAVNSTIIPQLYSDRLPISMPEILIDPRREIPSDSSRLDINSYRGPPNTWQQTMAGTPEDLAALHTLERPWPLFNTPSMVGTHPRYDIEYIYNPAVVGCGSRNQPCDGGSQEIIPNWKPPRSVSDENIAPRSVVFPEWNTRPQQVGVLYRITGPMNEELPLYGKRTDEIHWMYYTIIGPEKDHLMRVEGVRKGEKLGQNDEVMIIGLPGTFRVTQYNDETPLFM